ncbi:hypothetical protein LEN26_020238 [Aphanomyces euteiches]|nr:hypothetical protein LEN26_020238 [Aphanomyces euteiches]KAH9121501.1 hypothetical protein AeMF1_006819 [Aphanomyces euteiches]KAH9162698.1 hypothetical protein AeNC1_018816 [Aphanomyces euteiches]
MTRYGSVEATIRAPAESISHRDIDVKSKTMKELFQEENSTEFFNRIGDVSSISIHDWKDYLQLAALYRCNLVLETLVQTRPSSNGDQAMIDETPLLCAMFSGNVEGVEILLKAGAEIGKNSNVVVAQETTEAVIKSLIWAVPAIKENASQKLCIEISP